MGTIDVHSYQIEEEYSLRNTSSQLENGMFSLLEKRHMLLKESYTMKKTHIFFI